MKTAISIPDALFEAADRLAKQQGVARSRLYASALETYLAEHGPMAVTEQLNAVYDVASSDLDEAVAQTQISVLSDEAW